MQNPSQAARATSAALLVMALAALPWGDAFAEQAQPPGGKALAGAKRGTDAAGQGIAHGDRAARSGIARGSEKAASPVRNFGESLGHSTVFSGQAP